MLDMNCNCQEQQDALFDMARGIPVEPPAEAALAAHLDECEPCRMRMARERAMTAGLRAVARSVDEVRPAVLEPGLLKAFGELHPLQPVVQARGTGWRRWVAAAAAVVLVVAGLGLTWQRMNRVADVGSLEPQPRTEVVSEFVPWPGAASLPAFESGQLVRTELPASALPLLGLVPAGTVTDNKVLADVLIGQDGLARAVRLATF
jgi:hypothetical protein